MSQELRKGPKKPLSDIFREGQEVKQKIFRLKEIEKELYRFRQEDTDKIAASCRRAAHRLEIQYQHLVAASFRKAEKR